MGHLLVLMLQHPLRTLLFAQSFAAQVVLVLLKRILLPHFPVYQSLRLQLQRAYLAAANVTFPDIVHRLPVGDVPQERARKIDPKLQAYLIPGSKDLSRYAKAPANGKSCVVLYAHGGGYARGEPRMYMNYMERWVKVASRAGLDIVFLSVKYPLSTESQYPAQRESFLNGYRYLLKCGIKPQRIVFMGDSAGGGLSVLSGIELIKLGLPQPAGSVLISPWMDMATSTYVGGSPTVETDYLVGGNIAVPWMAAQFRGPIPGDSPEVNPLYCQPSAIHGLNPQLILVGAAEFALYDSKKWDEVLTAANIKHKLVVEWGQLHIFAMGSTWVDPKVRTKTQNTIVDWIKELVA